MKNNWNQILFQALKKSLRWSIVTTISLIVVVFGDLIGFYRITKIIPDNPFLSWAIAIIPFIIMILIGIIGSLIKDPATKAETDVQEEPPLYKIKDMTITRKIEMDGSVSVISYREIEVLTEVPLPSITHRRTSTAKDIQFVDHELNITRSFHGGGGTITHKVKQKTDSLVIWNVIFTPPLEKGQNAFYEQKFSSKKTYIMSMQEINDDLALGLREKNFESYKFHLREPADKLNIQIIFPPHFKITFPDNGGFNVYIGSISDVLCKTEYDRLRKQDAFKARLNPATDTWTLELNVVNGKKNLSYALEWFPQ